VKWPCTSIGIATLSTPRPGRTGSFTRLAHRPEPALLGARHRDEHPAGRLGEQVHERVHALGQHDPAAGLPGQRCLDDGLDEPTLAEVVGGRDQSVARGGGEHLRQQLLAGQIHLRRHTTEVVGGDLRPDRPVELVVGVAEQQQGLSGLGAQTGRDTAGHIVDDAEHPTTGVGRIGVRRSGCRS
jgi:hypothetical protein